MYNKYASQTYNKNGKYIFLSNKTMYKFNEHPFYIFHPIENYQSLYEVYPLSI